MVLRKVVHQPAGVRLLCGLHQSVRGSPQRRDDDHHRLTGVGENVSNALEVRSVPQARATEFGTSGRHA